MKISELEDRDQLATKDFLAAEFRTFRAEVRLELQQFKSEMLQLQMTSQRWNVGLIMGLYATNIGVLLAILLK